MGRKLPVDLPMMGLLSGLIRATFGCKHSKNVHFCTCRGTPLTPMPRARPPQEIKGLRWEVHKIGVNINQIARSVNAGIANAEDARQGLYLLNRVYELMYEVAKR